MVGYGLSQSTFLAAADVRRRSSFERITPCPPRYLGGYLWGWNGATERTRYFFGKALVRAWSNASSNPLTLAQLEQKLKSLPEDSQVIWNNTVGVNHELELQFDLPSHKTIWHLKKVAKTSDVKIEIAPNTDHDVHLLRIQFIILYSRGPEG